MRTSTATAPPGLLSASPAKRQQVTQRGLLIRANFRAAIKALMVNGTRSILTMLGVIIGVAAVITATTQAEGISAKVNQSFSSLGANVMTVMSGSPPFAGASGGFIISLGGGRATLSLNDASALSTLPHVVQVGPIISQQEPTTYLDQSGNYNVNGVSDSYPAIHNLQISEGSWFSSAANSSSSPDVVIGSLVAQSLFGPLKTDPVGHTINIRGSFSTS